MPTLPVTDFFGHRVSRLICGGNPMSGISHVNAEMDREMLEYYTMPNLLALLDECQAQGINTFQSRGDRHQMRMYLEHRLNGGRRIDKPCIGFKIMAASRNCTTPESTAEALRFALNNIKPIDLVDVGMFQKHRNQVRENADTVRRVLGEGKCPAAS